MGGAWFEDSAVEKESNPSESVSREMADNQNQAAEGDGNTTNQNQDLAPPDMHQGIQVLAWSLLASLKDTVTSSMAGFLSRLEARLLAAPAPLMPDPPADPPVGGATNSNPTTPGKYTTYLFQDHLE